MSILHSYVLIPQDGGSPRSSARYCMSQNIFFHSVNRRGHDRLHCRKSTTLQVALITVPSPRTKQVAFIARMRRDLRKRRARQTSTRDSIRIDALPATDDDHRRYRATATTANAATASSPASSPVDTTKTAATRHHAAMKLTHSAVAEGGRSYHYARGATSNEAPASTVVSKEAQPPVPDTANNPVSSRKPHQSATQNGHGPSPNILATPTGPRVTARDDSDVHRGGDGMSRGDQITRPFTAHNLTTEGPRAASLLRNRERGRGTA